MYSALFIAYGCISIVSGSSGPSYAHLDEREDSMIPDLEFNSDRRGLSLSEYLAQTYDTRDQLMKSVPATPVISSCAAFIDYFGALSANFTNCVVTFARPLRVCENCIEEYLRAKSAFDLVMKGKHKDAHNADCGDLILNSDRIQIIVRTFGFIQGIWDDCHCDNCFEFADTKNRTVHYRLSNETIQFHQLAVDTLKCFENNSMIILPYNITGKNGSTVCSKCEDIYHELNELYNHIIDKDGHSICMDIVDTVNSTRLEWSQVYGCSFKQVDPTPVFIISGLFCLLPIAFYLGNCIYVTRSQNDVVQNKTNGQDPPEDTDVNDSS